MAMDRAELEFQSLFLYLKEGVLAKEFSIEVQNEPLSVEWRETPDGQLRNDVYRVDPSLGAYGDLPVTDGRGWLSFENAQKESCEIYDPVSSGYISTYVTPYKGTSLTIPTERESTLVTVRDQNSDVIPRDYYRIDYNKGRIRFPSVTTPSGALTNIPTSIDYNFHMVSLVEGYPSNDKIPPLPLVSIYPIKGYKKGYQVGPGIKSKNKYCIEVFATSEQEKRKILNTIHNNLINKKAPVIDFNRSGMPLEQWGAVNDDFIQDIDYKGNTYRSYLTLNPNNGQNLYFVDIEMSNIPLPTGMSETLRHRGKIEVMTCTYTDRDPTLVGKYSTLEEPIGGFDSLIRKGYST